MGKHLPGLVLLCAICPRSQVALPAHHRPLRIMGGLHRKLFIAIAIRQWPLTHKRYGVNAIMAGGRAAAFRGRWAVFVLSCWDRVVFGVIRLEVIECSGVVMC